MSTVFELGDNISMCNRCVPGPSIISVSIYCLDEELPHNTTKDQENFVDKSIIAQLV